MSEKKIKKIEDVKKVPTSSKKTDWYNLDLGEVAKKLGITKHGLSQKQIKDRLDQHGLNILPEEPLTSSIVLFLKQFQSSLTYILIIAAIISFVIGEHIDAYVIMAAVAINVIVGFFQEFKAQKALASLKKIVAHKVWVIREEQEREIESKDLVPGDIVVLTEGVKISADGRLFEAEHFKVNEAALTGESEHVEKITSSLGGELVPADQHNMVFTGTVVTQGHGRFFVTKTGINTEIGKIAALVKETKEVRTPLQKKLDTFSKKLGLLVLALSAVLLVVGLLYGRGLGEMFVTAVAVAVAAIPEGLVVGVTVILAIGMQRILKKKSLVRKLVAAETLGSTNVICADKTGTVTLGEMRVVKMVTAHPGDDEKSEQEIKKLNQIAVYCNNAVIASAEAQKSTEKEELRNQIVVGSPTEKALLLSAIDGEFKESQLHEPRPRLDEIPFTSKHKFMASLNMWTKNQHIVYLKGAPEKILKMCDHYQAGRTTRKLDEKKRKEFLKLYEKLSKQGLRILAGAYKGVAETKTSFDELHDYNEDAIFVGFWGIKDPLRPEAEETIKLTHKAGIRTIIITGDNRHTAIAIANELGVNPKLDEVIDGAELASISAPELGKIVKHVKVFSRTTPEDKLRIVAALQSNGDVVAMTGDGVNDAPALAKADIGVALGSGTDVAKETADMIVLDNNFSTIVAAVKQGRVIFDNIRKVTLYLLSDGFSEMILIMGGLLLGMPLVLLPAQILWINLVTDGLPHLALTQEPEEPEIMSDDPHKRGAPILDFERKFLIFFISIITAVSTLALFYIMLKTTGDLEKARTIAFVTLGIDSLLYVFSVRSVRHSIFESNILRNKWLLLAVVGGFIIQVLGVYTPFLQNVLRTVPLTMVEWFIILSVCLWVIGLIEVVKHYFISQRRTAR